MLRGRTEMLELKKRVRQLEAKVAEIERMVASMQAALSLSDDGLRVRCKRERRSESSHRS